MIENRTFTAEEINDNFFLKDLAKQRRKFEKKLR